MAQKHASGSKEWRRGSVVLSMLVLGAVMTTIVGGAMVVQGEAHKTGSGWLANIGTVTAEVVHRALGSSEKAIAFEAGAHDSRPGIQEKDQSERVPTISAAPKESISKKQSVKEVASLAKSEKPADPVVLPAVTNACAKDFEADPTRQALINEIAWMGTPSSSGQSGNREWLELRNLSSSSISLLGWEVTDPEGNFSIKFKDNGLLPGNGFYLLERTNDKTITGVVADGIYHARLSNQGLTLGLFDASCHLVDLVDGEDGWPGGSNTTKATLERDVVGFDWHTSLIVGGTPKAPNTTITVPTSTPNLPPVATTTPPTATSTPPTPPEPPVVYEKILINEIQVASASSSQEEFVELYNPHDHTVNLTGWYMQKKTKTASSFSTFAPKNLFEGRTIPAHGYVLLAHPSSSVAADIRTAYGLAEDNTIVLKDPDGAVEDKVGWGEALDYEGSGAAPNPPEGQSIERKMSGTTFQDSDNNSADFGVMTCLSPKGVQICPPPTEDPQNPTSTTPTQDPTSTIPIPNPTSTTPLPSSTDPGTPTSTVPDPAPTSTPSTPSSTLNHLVILEIKTTGGTGQTANDFIRIFNPTSQTIDISNWRIKKRTQSGAESSIKVFPTGSLIAPSGTFTWANGVNDFYLTVGANVSSTATIADNNSLALLDEADTIVDAVAWGEGLVSPYVEGNAFGTNPVAPQILTRKTGPVDTDNNTDDFELR